MHALRPPPFTFLGKHMHLLKYEVAIPSNRVSITTLCQRENSDFGLSVHGIESSCLTVD